MIKLMDALEYGGDDYDEELDDYERKMIREQQALLGRQPSSTTTASGGGHRSTNSAH